MPRRLSSLALLSLLLAGCGGSNGHHSSSTDPTATVGPRVTISWPARTREFVAPAGATTAVVTFPSADAGSPQASQTLARPTSDAAVTTDYQLAVAVHPGRHLMTIDFYSGGTFSAPLATATLNVVVQNDGTLRTINGQKLPTITPASAVTALSVQAGQTVEVGESLALAFAATNDAGAIVALPPGVLTLRVVSGGDALRANADGTLTGLVPGNATVTATYQGIASIPVAVAVLPAPLAARVVSLDTNAFVADPARGLLWTATPDGKVRSVDPASGAFGAPIAVGSNPTVLAISDDGSTLYAGLQASGSVRKIDLATNTAGLQFAIPPQFGSAGYALDIAVQPAHPDTVALTTQDFNDSGNVGPQIYDDGVRRPNSLGIYQGTRLLWTDESRLVAWDTSSTDDTLRGVAVDVQGATLAQSVSSGLNSFATRFVLSGGRLYDRSGVVFDAQTLTRLGAFDLGLTGWFGDTVLGPAIDVSAKRAYFVVLSNGSLRLLAFNTDTFAPTNSRRIAGIENPTATAERPNLLKIGTRLAVRLPDRLVILDDLTGF